MTAHTKRIIAREVLIFLGVVLMASIAIFVFLKYPEEPSSSVAVFRQKLDRQQKEIFEKGTINEKPPVLQKLHADKNFLAPQMQQYANIRKRLRVISLAVLIFGYCAYLLLFRLPIRPISPSGQR